MASIIIPRKWQRQPQQAVEPDWKNELLNGVKQLYNGCDPTTGTLRNYANPLSSPVVTGTVTRGETDAGVGWQPTTAANCISEVIPTAEINAQKPWTYAFVLSTVTPTLTNFGVAGIFNGIANSTHDRGLQTNGSPFPFQGYFYDGTQHFVAGTTNVVANTEYRIVLSCDAPKASLYVNGMLEGQYTTLANNGYNGYSTPLWVLGPDVSGSSGVTFALAVRIDGIGWSQGEAEAFANTPYQVWKRRALRFYLLPAAGGVDNISEAGAAVDTTAATLIAAGSITEAGSAADTTTAATVTAQAIAEAGSAADTTAAGKATGAAISESGAAVDTTTAANVTTQAVSESGVAADTVAGIWVTSAAISESGVAADTVGSAWVTSAAVSESGAATDTTSASVASGGVNAISESGAASDTVTAGAAFVSAQAEAGAAADITTGAIVTQQAIVEAGGAADTTDATKVSGGVSAIVESGNAIDSCDAHVIAFGSIAEGTASAADVVAVRALWAAAIAEFGAAIDTVTSGAPTLIGEQLCAVLSEAIFAKIPAESTLHIVMGEGSLNVVR
jgi:hypothetical protein